MKKYIILLITILLLSGCSVPDDTLCINGMYMGKKTTEKMQNLVMDASFLYEYENVGFDVDQNDCVEFMCFSCTYNAKSEVTCGLSDIELIYHGKRLETTEDVIDCFGQNYVPAQDERYEFFTFEDDELNIEISLINGEFNGIKVEKK